MIIMIIVKISQFAAWRKCRIFKRVTANGYYIYHWVVIVETRIWKESIMIIVKISQFAAWRKCRIFKRVTANGYYIYHWVVIVETRIWKESCILTRVFNTGGG